MEDKSSSKTEDFSTPDLQFDEIAFLYDELMAGVPYRQWIDYVFRITRRYGCHPRAILDLCCGTGNVSLLLAEDGYQVSGVDISPGMIECAKRKAEQRGVYVDFHARSASELHLRRKFDLVISLFDSLNYILESSELQQAFHRVSAHLEPGGLFIFDMNTELALAMGFFNQSNLGNSLPVHYNWHSSYDRATQICSIRMDFRYRRGGADKHVEVMHYQRAYGQDEIAGMLRVSGLEVLAVFNAYTFRKAAKSIDRIFFVAGKPSEPSHPDLSGHKGMKTLFSKQSMSASKTQLG